MKRAIAFFDGQNLYHSAKEAFGYTYPNYDVAKLAQAVCSQQGWHLAQARFYTGVHTPDGNEFLHRFWAAKLGAMGRQGVIVFRRALRYQNTTVELPDGRQGTAVVGQEKGIDIRIALDVVSHVLENACDVALVFSQDQDLSEVADEVRKIATRQKRWIKIASAFPIGPTSRNRRGINRTDWVRIDKATYDSCIDRWDHRPKK
jgi:uncharacterized LabA/DUF88 family protein